MNKAKKKDTDKEVFKADIKLEEEIQTIVKYRKRLINPTYLAAMASIRFLSAY